MSEEQNLTQAPTQQPSQQPMGQTFVINQVEKKSNGVGTAGFVLALLAIVFCWVPILDFILWFLGALLSFIGLFKRPKGLAITGFLLSIGGIILIVMVLGAGAAGLAAAFS